MVVHVAYHTLSVSVIAIVSIVVAIFVSVVVRRLVVAWLLSAGIVGGQVFTHSLLTLWVVTPIRIVISLRLSFFSHCHDYSLLFSRQFD